MKNTNLRHSMSCAALLIGGMVLSSLALAGGGSERDEFKMMDSNADGMVSPEEHAAGVKTMFDQLDTDKDGNMTAAEIDAAHKGMDHGNGMSSADKIKMMDTDGDGKLSAAEHGTGAQSMFDKSDANKDGSVDAAEMKAAHEAMMGKKAMDKKQGM